AELVLTLAQAMHHAHQQGVIHRDLKPANILLHWEGEAPAEPGIKRGTEGSAGASPSLDLLQWEGEAPAEPGIKTGTKGSAGASPSLDRCIPKLNDFGLAKQLHLDQAQPRR